MRKLTILLIMVILLSGCVTTQTTITTPENTPVPTTCENILPFSGFIDSASGWLIIQMEPLGDGFISLWTMIPDDPDFKIQKALVMVVTQTLWVQGYLYICDGEVYGSFYDVDKNKYIPADLSTDSKEFVWDKLYI